MQPEKKPIGRPRGTKYPRQFTVYTTDQGYDLLNKLAERRETTQAELIRQLVREEARRVGLVEEGGAE